MYPLASLSTRDATTLLLSLTVLVQSGYAATSAAPLNATSVPAPITTVTDASVFSYIYAVPLVAFAKLAAPLLTAVGPNEVVSAQTLSGPQDTTVVRPNVDTLYSTGILDLSQDDLVLTVPNISDGRYWLFPFYDLYGKNFADISIIANSPPGDYLIRRASDSLQQPAITYTKTTANCIPRYQGVVDYPTTYGTLLVRILVRGNSTTELATVHKYQAGIGLKAVPRTTTQPYTLPAPALTASLLQSNASSAPAQLLSLLARLAPFNGPEILPDAYRVASTLGLAGLAGGVYNQPPSINLTAISATAATSIAAVASLPSNIVPLGNGWSVLQSSISGNFGTNYAARALIANSGYLQLTSEQVIYPSWSSGGPNGSSMSLGKNESYLITFSGRPPILSDGFWSLTVYNADQSLVSNPLNRYEIGDRTQGLKFVGGREIVYGSNASAVDGAFQVLIQPADVAPPGNWTRNWLPAPAGGGPLSFTLRFYAPTPAFENGSYVYPVVQKVAAIVA